MISVEELLYEIDFKLNKIATSQHQSVPEEDKLISLNNAQLNFILSKLGTNNTYQLGLDAFKKRYEDLEVLIEAPDKHPLEIQETDTKLHKWEASLATIEDYMFYIDSYALATKEHCKDVIIYVNNDLTKHSNVTTLLNNSNYVPSFEYQETFNTISNKVLELYTDGTFNFSTVFVSYLRYPKQIDIEGYIKLDGTESISQSCELPYYLKDTITNLALLDLGFATENSPAIQQAQTKQSKEE